MANREKLLAKTTKYLDKQFKKVDITQRKALFLELKNWALSELNDEAQDLFLDALYSAPSTQDIQILLAVDKAVKGATNDINKKN